MDSEIELIDDASRENFNDYFKRKKEDDEVCIIYESNLDTFLFFQSISSYWQYGAMGGIISLDWPTIMSQVSQYEKYPEDVLYDFYGFKKVTLKMIKGVQIIESVARTILNERLK